MVDWPTVTTTCFQFACNSYPNIHGPTRSQWLIASYFISKLNPNHSDSKWDLLKFSVGNLKNHQVKKKTWREQTRSTTKGEKSFSFAISPNSYPDNLPNTGNQGGGSTIRAEVPYFACSWVKPISTIFWICQFVGVCQREGWHPRPWIYCGNFWNFIYLRWIQPRRAGEKNRLLIV